MNFRTTALLIVVLAFVGGYLFFTRNSSAPAPSQPSLETKNAQQLVNLDDGNAMRTFSGHSGAVNSVAFSPDATEVLSGSADKSMILWDAASSRQIQTFAGDYGQVNCVAFSPDGKTAASACGDGDVRLWDLSTGQMTRSLIGHTASVTHLAFSPDGTQLLSSSEDKTLILWDLSTSQPERTFKGHTSEVTSCAFLPDGKTAISCSDDGTLKQWNLADGSVIRTFNAASPVYCLAISPDGKTLVSGQIDGSLKSWDIASGSLIHSWLAHKGEVAAVAFSPDGQLLLSGGNDGMKLWQMPDGQPLRNFTGDIGSVTCVAFSPDSHLALSGGQDDTIRLWDLARDVSKISITRDDGSQLIVQRTLTPSSPQPVALAASNWEITAPLHTAADQFNTDDLLSSIVTATSTAQVPITNDAASYGLDDPQYRIDLTSTVGGKVTTISIGRQVATGDELYAQVAGQNVAQVIDGSLLDKLDTNAEKLRQTKLLDVDTTAINHITIDRPHDSLSLTKNGDQWTMTEPLGHSASPRSADGPLTSELLSSIDTLRADSFAPAGADAARLIGKPQATVTIEKADLGAVRKPRASGTFATLQFSQPDLLGKTVWVHVLPMNLLAAVPKDSVDAILKSPLDLLNRDVLKIDPADVTSIQISKGNTITALLTRRPIKPQSKVLGPFTRPSKEAAPQTPQSTWVLDKPKKTDADDTKISSLLSQLQPLHVDNFLATAPTSEPSSIVNWTLTLTTAKATYSLLLHDPGAASPDEVVGVYQGQAFQIPRTLIESMDVDFAKSASSNAPPTP
ncbi:MAG TPA: DUF4340 domain-containing protein [Tepidisphaeraceae bacterium]|nr:DUF4340 domain-containing protein [Tepidisphaeraceae bacterium]